MLAGRLHGAANSGILTRVQAAIASLAPCRIRFRHHWANGLRVDGGGIGLPS